MNKKKLNKNKLNKKKSWDVSPHKKSNIKKKECGEYFLLTGNGTKVGSPTYSRLSIKKVEDSHTNSSFGSISVWSMDNGVYIWSVRMYNKTTDTVIGVFAGKACGGDPFYSKPNGFGLCTDGRKVVNTAFTNYCSPFEWKDVIKIKLDLNKKQLSFLKNDVDQGVAFNKIPCGPGIYYRLAVKMYHAESHITILDFIRPQSSDLIANDDEKKESKNKVNQLQNVISELKKELNKCNQINKQHEATIINLQRTISKSDEERKEMEIKMNAMKQEIQSLKQKAINVDQYEDWTSDEIVIWIMSIENGRYKRYGNDLLKSLKNSEVSGDDLNTMDANDLQGFGITNYKDRKALIRSIHQLKQKNNNLKYKQNVNEGLPEATAYI